MKGWCSKCQLLYPIMVEIWPLSTCVKPNFSSSKCQLCYLFTMEIWPLSTCLIPNFSGSKCHLRYLFMVEISPVSTCLITNFCMQVRAPHPVFEHKYMTLFSVHLDWSQTPVFTTKCSVNWFESFITEKFTLNLIEWPHPHKSPLQSSLLANHPLAFFPWGTIEKSHVYIKIVPFL